MLFVSMGTSTFPSDSRLLRVSFCLPDSEISLRVVVFASAGDFPPQPPSHLLSKLEPARAQAAAVAVCGVCRPVCQPAGSWCPLQTG